MGIVRGFIAGAGKGLADVSTMMLQQKLQEERDEANFLRDKELRKEDREATMENTLSLEEQKTRARQAETLQAQEFEAGQTEKELAADTENTKLTVGAKGEGSGDSAAIKMATYLRNQGYDPAIADGVAAGAIEIIKDEKSGELTAINSLTGKKIGGLEKAPGASRRDPKVWTSEKDKEQAPGQKFNFVEDMAKKSMEGGLINGQRAPEKPAATQQARTQKATGQPSQAAIAVMKANVNDPATRAAFEAKFPGWLAKNPIK